MALPAGLATAQNLPTGPSPLVIDVYNPVTNTAAKTNSAPQKVPQGPSPLVPGEYGEAPRPVAETGLLAPKAPQEPIPLITDAYQQVPGVAVPESEGSGTTAVRTSFLMAAGSQYVDEKEYKEAERAYLQALDASPGNADIRFLLSTLYIQMERYAEAAGILEKLAAEFPDNPMLHNNLSWVYATGGRMKNGKLAVRHAREALLIIPYAPSLWNTLAEAYYVSGLYENALRSSDCALELLRSQQNVPEADIRTFEAQHTKIKRANESSKRLLGLDTGK